MSDSVVRLSTGEPPNVDKLVSVLEGLIEELKNGTMIAFYGVGIKSNDEIAFYHGSAGRVSNLRAVGATTYLTHSIVNGDIQSEDL